MFQNRDVSLKASIMQLQSTKSFLERCMFDEGFEKILIDTIEAAEEMAIFSSFKQGPGRKSKRKWRMRQQK